MVRSSRGEKLIRRARERGAMPWVRLRGADGGAGPRGTAPIAAAESGAPAEPPSPVEGDPSLDVAVYTCSCGYVFEALVSTSVGCPHCGDRQAW